jgi:hypothetical protein
MVDLAVLLINAIGICIAVWTLWRGARNRRIAFPKHAHGGLVTEAERPILFWTHMLVQLAALIGCSYFAVGAATRLAGGADL